MSKHVKIGGNRLGSGNKMEVAMHGYGKTSHDLGYVWKSTVGVGMLIPFLHEYGTNGDEFNINLSTLIRTHPTVGALFGSFKLQLDVFKTPLRYYIRELHNNKKGIGNHMENVYLPQMNVVTSRIDPEQSNPNQQQISGSSLLSYLGIRGNGRATDG